MIGGKSPAQALWNTVKHWSGSNAEHYVYASISSDSGDPLTPYASYFRLWLSQMFLAKSSQWGAEWFPAVHAEVRLNFGDRGASTFTCIAQPAKDALARGGRLNYQLTELLPYAGGVVEIEASLLGLKGADYLGTAISVLQGFSSLVAAPLGQAISVAEKLVSGAHDLLQATNGRVHLGIHQSFVSVGGSGGAILAPSYLAVILATKKQLAHERLSVRDDQLLYRMWEGAPAEPLTTYDYMLLRVEGRAERDNWRLKNIDEPLERAIGLLAQGKTEEAQVYKTLTLATVWESADLAPLDKRRVVEAIKAELAQFEGPGRGAMGLQQRDLHNIMEARGISLAQAEALGELTPSDVLGR